MGMTLKKISFIYLITYLGVAAVGFGLMPRLTLKLFMSTGEYGEIMPRMLGAVMGLVSFLLYQIYRLDYWRVFSPLTIKARTPLVAFIFYIYYLSSDPLFLVINAIVVVGLVATVVGTLMTRGEHAGAA